MHSGLLPFQQKNKKKFSFLKSRLNYSFGKLTNEKKTFKTIDALNFEPKAINISFCLLLQDNFSYAKQSKMYAV